MRRFLLVFVGALNLLALSGCGDVPVPGQEEVGSTFRAATTPEPPTKGYRLFWDGTLVSQAFNWTRCQGVSNCQWNIKQYPQKKVECDYDGKRLGYELFWDGARVGYEPGWTRSQGVSNCQRNIRQHAQKKVECDYEGKRLGYELFWDDTRVGYEPGWSESKAIRNCAWNRKTYADSQPPTTARWVTCLHDGASVLEPIPTPTCGGIATYVVRTEDGDCEHVAGWKTCPVDPGVSSASRLCVYQFSKKQPSVKNLSDLTAIAAPWFEGSAPRTPRALEMCTTKRLACHPWLPAPPLESAASCDPTASEACCVDAGGKWDPDEHECRFFPPSPRPSCPDCSGFGFVEGGVLTVVLDPLDAGKPTHVANVFGSNGMETIRIERPQGEQIFSVQLPTPVPDQYVAEIRSR